MVDKTTYLNNKSKAQEPDSLHKNYFEILK